MSLIACSNQLLNYLDDTSRQLLIKHSEHLFLTSSTILAQPGDVNQYVYFPSTCVIGLMLHQNAKKVLEIYLVGEEGMMGVEAMLGLHESPYLALVQNEGMVFRLNTEQFMNIMTKHPMIAEHLHLYAGVMMQQLAQSSVCSHFHIVQARLARLLLMFRDRLHSNSIQLTHELLADMLGVRRVGVTKAAGNLQKNHTLRYTRGHIEILNEQALECVACSCYAIDKASYQLILNH